jgi:hypothetical protein
VRDKIKTGTKKQKKKTKVLGGGTILKDLEITLKAFFFLFEIPS